MSRFPSTHRTHQSGGITILVALMLLVLITIAAVSMSRNSFREVVTSGTTRQGAMTRNVADSGIEWGILYLDPNNASTGTNQSLATLASTLVAGQITGLAYDVSTQARIATLPNTNTPPADLQVPAGSGNGYNIALTLMGKAPTVLQSASVGSTSGGGNLRAASVLSKTDPDLWAIRSDALVTVGAVTFIHSKESWISTPVR
jgi:hypothetical protein